MNDHPPERVDPLLCVERELPLADLSSGFMRRKAMISYENTKTVRDLVWNTGREYAGRVFLRYEENDVVYEVTYDEFATQCRGVAAWLREQDAAAGHKVRVGLMGSSSHHYLVFLLGVMDGPSCSLAEALERQDLFINSTLAQLGCGILWKMFRNGVIEHNGLYLNLDTMKVNPIII